MQPQKATLFYAGITGAFLALLYWTMPAGQRLASAAIAIQLKPASGPAWPTIAEALRHGGLSPLALLLGQVVVILGVARVLGWASRKVGQPAVLGEMATGIALGPTLLGRCWPAASAGLFPAASLGSLQLLSQLGLILFMFGVGLDLPWSAIRGKVREAAVISQVSIVVPFGLGLGLAYFLHGAFAPAGVPLVAFGLFLGIAMSITAFPVLARIVRERGLHHTPLGTLVITCAAADDLTAWCLLAAVVALVKAGSLAGAGYVAGLALAYVLLMLGVVRPALHHRSARPRPEAAKLPLAPFFLTLIFSAFVAEVIGIHALFGAFLAGTIMPADLELRTRLSRKVRGVAAVLLPLFFVFTGLRTEIGLLDTPYRWGVCALITGVAVLGKFLGSALAARLVGHRWSDSLSIGALMNTRGLMELVVLNIGYDLGILSPPIFAMMVLMALVTTAMTGPALNLIQRWTGPSAAEEV